MRNAKLIYQLLIAVTASLMPTIPLSADVDFQFGGNEYRLVTTPESWIDAATAAASLERTGFDSGLAIIESAEENQFLFDQLVAAIPPAEFGLTDAPDGGGGVYVWIAATDRANEGQWIWDHDGDGDGQLFWEGTRTGSPVAGLYENWGRLNRQNEPDNFRGLQDGGAISVNGWPLGDAGEWNDVIDSNSLYYLVEFTPISLLGDFDNNGSIEANDIDLLSEAIAQGSDAELFDLNSDSQVDDRDRKEWVEEIAHSYFGDANLDGEFNSADIVAVFAAGEYEDATAANSGWQTGDWTGDSEFDTGDLVLAFQGGGFEQGPRTAQAATIPVPEPTRYWPILFSMLLLRSGAARRH